MFDESGKNLKSLYPDSNWLCCCIVLLTDSLVTPSDKPGGGGREFSLQLICEHAGRHKWLTGCLSRWRIIRCLCVANGSSWLHSRFHQLRHFIQRCMHRHDHGKTFHCSYTDTTIWNGYKNNTIASNKKRQVFDLLNNFYLWKKHQKPCFPLVEIKLTIWGFPPEFLYRMCRREYYITKTLNGTAIL